MSLVCLLTTGGNVFAANIKDIGPSGDSMNDPNITLEDQEQSLLNAATSEEDKNKIKNRFEEHYDLVEKSKKGSNEVSPLLTNDPSGTLSVPYFKQEKSYYCGPATTKQTVHFINGSSSTQGTIASAIGTTTDGSNLFDMVNYINNEQSHHDYLIINNPDEPLIQSIAEYAVRNDSPAIGRLKIAKGGNWAYSSVGHFLNVSGYSDYGRKIRITDPYIGWVQPSSSGSYYVTSNEFYTATNNHFADQISY